MTGLNFVNLFIGRCVAKTYTTAKVRKKISFYLNNRSKINAQHPPLLIYQMGKVASSSIYRSIKQYWAVSPVYHVHVLSNENLRVLDRVIRKSYPRTHNIPDHLLAGEFLRRYIPRTSPKTKWKIITLVRDPIARNISSFFQDLKTRHLYLEYSKIIENHDIEGAAGLLADAFLKNHDHSRPLNWFDMELKRVFKIDIFSMPFDKESGFKIYNSELGSALLIKLEKLRECAEPALSQFLKMDGFRLIDENISDKKEYASLYHTVRQSIKFPDDFITKIYSSKLVRHVYTDNEINQFKFKWCSVN